MSAFRPESYAEALATRTPLRSRKPMARRSAKPKKKKREKMPSRSKLVKELDRLTSLIVRHRDKKCVLCGSAVRLQCGHVFGRRSHGARWDIDPGGNCYGQCAGCNQRHNYDPNKFFRWFITNFGSERFDALYRRWTKGRKYSRLELIELVKEYEIKLNSVLQCEAGQPSMERQTGPAETTNGDALAAWQSP